MDFDSFSPGLILVLVVGLAMAPYLAVMVTAFTKLVVVLSLLRNALGLQQTPPNMVLNGLAIILSIYVMYPVGLEISDLVEDELSKQSDVAELSRLLTIANRAKGTVARISD